MSTSTDQAEAPPLPFKPILRVVVGSTAHGLNVDDGIEDRDEMAICIEDFEDACGLRRTERWPKDPFIYRSAAVREGREDAKSQAGDLDFTMYSLRKYCMLALKGSPTILLALYATPIEVEARGSVLQEMAPMFASKLSGHAFLGYLHAQRHRLLGTKGQKGVNRPELVERHGYDVKYATHMLRLGMQGCELMMTGRLTLPMEPGARSYLRDVRQGRFQLEAVVKVAEQLERQLSDEIRATSLPDDPDYERVNDWMLSTYWETWRARRYLSEHMFTLDAPLAARISHD
jgi:uncharacterized protein